MPAEPTVAPVPVAAAVKIPADFADDPFKDYRYEDPFSIKDPFADESIDGKIRIKPKIKTISISLIIHLCFQIHSPRSQPLFQTRRIYQHQARSPFHEPATTTLRF